MKLHLCKALVGVALLLAPGCRGPGGCCGQPSGRGRRPKAPQVLPVTDGRAVSRKQGGLSGLVQEVAQHCAVTAQGRIHGCRGRALGRLEARERELGSGAALQAHCRALSRQRGLTRAVLLGRLDSLARAEVLERTGADGPAALSCLLDVLGRAAASSDVVLARIVARAAALLAGAVSQEQRLVQVLEGTEQEAVRAAGYGSLWALGRLRALGPISRVAHQDRSLQVRVAAIQGFGQGLAPGEHERGAVCTLLGPLIEDGELVVASAAALQAASACPDQAPHLVAVAEGLVRRGLMDLGFINALGALGEKTARGTASGAAPVPRPRAPQPLAPRIQELLGRVVGQDQHPALVRSTALRQLARLDARAGADLARRHHDDPSFFVRSTARSILGEKDDNGR